VEWPTPLRLEPFQSARKGHRILVSLRCFVDHTMVGRASDRDPVVRQAAYPTWRCDAGHTHSTRQPRSELVVTLDGGREWKMLAICPQPAQGSGRQLQAYSGTLEPVHLVSIIGRLAARRTCFTITGAMF
jgi:hypothetical protein